MRQVFAVAIAAACSALAAAPPVTHASEIRKLLADQADAWTRGDIEAFCAAYADDATFLSPSGLTRGRDAVLARYRKKYVDKAGMGALTLSIDEIRSASKSSASVVARWTLKWPDKPEASGWSLIVLEKKDAGWRIVQDASM